MKFSYLLKISEKPLYISGPDLLISQGQYMYKVLYVASMYVCGWAGMYLVGLVCNWLGWYPKPRDDGIK